MLEKKTKLKFSECDIYVNVAGGVRITESSVDAALAAALYSARTDLPLKDKMVISPLLLVTIQPASLVFLI